MTLQDPVNGGEMPGGWVRLPEALRTINAREALAAAVATAIGTGSVPDPANVWALTVIAAVALAGRERVC